MPIRSITPVIEKLNHFSTAAASWQQEEEKLSQLTDSLNQAFHKIEEKNNQLNHKTDQHEKWAELVKLFATVMQKQQYAWQQKAPVRQLSASHQEKFVLLIYGKVNAGKSSLINFLAEQFADALSTKPKFFAIQNGQKVHLEKPLKTGATETTAQIQGVEIGPRLVILDTPGLHSVTPENHQLAEQFTEAADALIWATESDSPGEVEELEALQAELKLHYPLLPVITRSDRLVPQKPVELDESGEPVRIYQNKDAETRRLQEDDVYQRTCQHLDQMQDKLRRPISISIKAFEAAVENGQDVDQAAEEAGLHSLFNALLPIIDEAATTKALNARRHIISHLQDNVLQPLEHRLLSQIKQVRNDTKNQIEKLRQTTVQLSAQLQASLTSDLPLIVDQLQDADKSKWPEIITDRFLKEAQAILQEAMQDYLEQINQNLSVIFFDLSPEELGDFKPEYIEIKQKTGSGGRVAASVAASIVGFEVGVAIGTALFPGLGTVIGGVGGLIGGWLGDRFGSFLESEEIERIQVDINTEVVEQHLIELIDAKSPLLMEQAIGAFIQQLAAFDRNLDEIESILIDFKSRVKQLEGTLQ